MDDQRIGDVEAREKVSWLASCSALLEDEAAALLTICNGHMNTAAMCITLSKASNVGVLEVAAEVMKSKS